MSEQQSTPLGRRVSLTSEQVQFFNRQLASMARLNMPISKGLRILARDVQDGDFRALSGSVQQDLDEGLALQTIGGEPGWEQHYAKLLEV